MYFIRDYDGPKIYQPGSNPDVLILGQDPTVDDHRRFETVLGIEGTGASSNLKRYIFSRILEPLNIEESRILATNLVNLYYYDVPNKKIAKKYEELIVKTAEEKGIDIDQYLQKNNGAILHALNFEAGTRKDLEYVLNHFPIKHVITLGEPVFQVLRERYKLALQLKIKAVLESLNDRPPLVHIGGKQVSLLPLPHIFRENNERWQFYSRFINEDLARLSSWYSGIL